MRYEKYPPRDEPVLDPSQNTRDWIDLKLNSLKGEMRVWFIAAIAGNQVLAHVTLSPLLGYLGGGATIAAVAVIKIVFIR